ncbi:MAG: LamG domain-containing protein, partial [Planctomycetota bacterium]
MNNKFVWLCACLGLIVPAPLLAGEAQPLRDKTLVAWVTPANLEQRGGSVLTIEKPGGVFDAIVFGELAPARWMAGSNLFQRTNRNQNDVAAETAGQDTLVQVAIVYRGREITIYRNGSEYSRYTVKHPETFGTDSHVLMGLRHLDAAPANRYWTGSIDDARIYDRALTAEQIRGLVPNQPSDPQPIAWWDFERGSTSDRAGRFAVTTLIGHAR